MSVTFAFDANDPVTGIESRYFCNEIGLTAPGAVQIDTLTDGQGIGNDLGQYGAVYSSGSDLFTITHQNNVAARAIVWKSTDSGLTWTALDSGNGPTRPAAQCFDGAHTITVLYALNNVAPIPFQFQDFDLVTGLWSAPYGGGNPVLKSTVAFIQRRTNNTILVVTSGGFGAAGQTSMLAAHYDIGLVSWSAVFDPGVNITTLPGYNGPTNIIQANRITHFLDANDKTGIFFCNTAFNFAKRVFFQQILEDDSLGVFTEIANADTLLGFPAPGGGPSFGQPVLLPGVDSIVLPVTALQPAPNNGLVYMTVLVGTPINNPVFTLFAGAGIDPGSRLIDGGDGSLTPQSFATGAADANNIYFVWTCTDSTQTVDVARFRISQTSIATPTAGWTPSTLFDMTVFGLPLYPAPVPPAASTQALFNPTALFSVSAPPVTGTSFLPKIIDSLNLPVVVLPDPSIVCGPTDKKHRNFQPVTKPCKC